MNSTVKMLYPKIAVAKSTLSGALGVMTLADLTL
jgi:hypothetical protein